jgi:flagellar protein FlaG
MSDISMSSAVQASGTSNPRVANSPIEEKKVPAQESKVVAAESKQPATTAKVAQQQAKAEPNAKELKLLTDELQRRVGGVDSQLLFSIDQTTGSSVVKVMDRATQEVIRQIPSEEMLQIAKGLDRYKEGMLISSKA